MTYLHTKLKITSSNDPLFTAIKSKCKKDSVLELLSSCMFEEKYVEKILHTFRAFALHMNLSYQPLHNNSFYSYMFRLPIVTIIREPLFTDVRSVQYVKNGNMYINYLQP
jgi:hypothetical protein